MSFGKWAPSSLQIMLYIFILFVLPIIWMALIDTSGLLQHNDWLTYFFPAFENYLTGLSPYAVDGIWNPTWFFLLLASLASLGDIPSALIIEFLTLTILYLCVLWLTDDSSQTLIALVLLSPLNLYVVNQMWLGQVDIVTTFSGILLTILVARKASHYIWYAGIALVLLSLKPPSGIFVVLYIFWLIPFKKWWKMLIIPTVVGIFSLLFDFDLIIEFIAILQTRILDSERVVWDVTILSVADYYDVNEYITTIAIILVMGWITYLWRKNEDSTDRIMLITILGLLINAYVGWHHLILLFGISVPLILRRSQHPLVIITLFLIGFLPLMRIFFTGVDILASLAVLFLITVLPHYQK